MTAAVMPVRRNLEFHLPHNRISDWNSGGIHWTHFLNTLSIFFPAGERFFIQSIRNYRDQISEPELKKAIAAFIGQEAFHTREHEDYNHALAQALGTDEMEQSVEKLLARLQKILPKPFQLAVTVALEHLTAMMSQLVLVDDHFFKDSEPHYHALWQWHALEETEHKGVAYDVYEAVVGKGVKAYAIRTTTFLMANIIFWTLFYRFYFQVIKRENQHRNLKGWMTSLRYQFGRGGMFGRMLPEWLDFFRPGFHPWDQDNRHHLARAETLMQEVAGFSEVTGIVPPKA